MTTSSEDLVKLEAETIRTPRLSRHRARRRKRIAARTLLILGIVVGVWAVSDFVYNAYILTNYVQPRSRDSPIGSLGSESGYAGWIAAEYTDLMQRDAIAVLIAVALLVGSTLIFRRVKRHRR